MPSVCAGSCLALRPKRASRGSAVRIGKGVAPTVEADAQIDLVGRHVVAPKQVQRARDLSHVGMGKHVGSDLVRRRVPGAVQVVRHQVHPVHVLGHVADIEPAHVPIGCRGGKGQAPGHRRNTGVPRISDVPNQGYVVGRILGRALHGLARPDTPSPGRRRRNPTRS